ncbi:mannonate dehydratase [Candidatus Poribacteria bacterium]
MKGNKWSESGIKLGVSHQGLNRLNEQRFNFLKQMGVEYLEIRIPSNQSSYQEIVDIRHKVEDAGLKVFEIMLADKYGMTESSLGLPGGHEEIKLFKRFIQDLGKAGIDTTTYAWHFIGFPSERRTTTQCRGCSSRYVNMDDVEDSPNLYERVYTDEEMWDNYEHFIEQILPVAEDAGVRLQLHPNDPPATYCGVAQIFRSTAAFKRAMEISNHSPYSGILFCVGCWGEMSGSDGKGEDVTQAIYEFGSRGHIYQVHFRNVSSPLPEFYETFHDNGYLNMYRIMKALGEVNFNGMVVPDHVPRGQNTEGGRSHEEAYCIGYVRALIQAVNTELPDQYQR